MEFHCFGVNIKHYQLWESGKQIKTQAAKVSIMADCLNYLVWRNKYKRKETKYKIYKATVRPVMTYALETRAETAKTRHMLEANEMKILRKTFVKQK